jgi:hypothetical protein
MSFITDFFGKTGAGTSLVGDVGDIGISLVQNRGKQIEGEYKVELQKLLNDQTKTKAELDSELAKLNASRDAQLGEIKTEQTKLYLGYGLAIVAVIGVVVGLIVWIKD